MSDDSLYPPDWYALGKRDFQGAKVLLQSDDSLLTVAGMLLQQALEKYIKGYLLSLGWQLRRTHDLGLLLKALIEYEQGFSEFTDACLKITDFYLESRYPAQPVSPLLRPEVEDLFAQAEQLIVRIEGSTAQKNP
jgi:HEPN domain-containing protein